MARVIVENVNTPGKSQTVDGTSYDAMRRAMLKALPRSSPGLAYDELKAAVLPLLPEEVFPSGARAGWWIKLVQLDLEAKGLIAREKVRPLRWRRV